MYKHTKGVAMQERIIQHIPKSFRSKEKPTKVLPRLP